MIVRVSVVVKRTVGDSLSGRHLQSQVVETSVTVTSSVQNYTHPDDHTTQTTDTPGFKRFTILQCCCSLGAEPAFPMIVHQSVDHHNNELSKPHLGHTLA